LAAGFGAGFDIAFGAGFDAGLLFEAGLFAAGFEDEGLAGVLFFWGIAF
jgi:hypothetical protein